MLRQCCGGAGATETLVFKYFTRALRDQFRTDSDWVRMLAKIVVSDLRMWTFVETEQKNYVTINNVITPWENRRFSINGVRGDASGATHTIDEEVAEYNNDNNDEKEEVNHIEVRSETSL
jgi:hypothetical protein